jgi:hypothetical protein
MFLLSGASLINSASPTCSCFVAIIITIIIVRGMSHTLYSFSSPFLILNLNKLADLAAKAYSLNP